MPEGLHGGAADACATMVLYVVLSVPAGKATFLIETAGLSDPSTKGYMLKPGDGILLRGEANSVHTFQGSDAGQTHVLRLAFEVSQSGFARARSQLHSAADACNASQLRGLLHTDGSRQGRVGELLALPFQRAAGWLFGTPLADSASAEPTLMHDERGDTALLALMRSDAHSGARGPDCLASLDVLLRTSTEHVDATDRRGNNAVALACARWDASLASPAKECVDTNEGCERWAIDGECAKNPAFMQDACRQSCKSCPASAELAAYDAATVAMLLVHGASHVSSRTSSSPSAIECLMRVRSHDGTPWDMLIVALMACALLHRWIGWEPNYLVALKRVYPALPAWAYPTLPTWVFPIFLAVALTAISSDAGTDAAQFGLTVRWGAHPVYDLPLAGSLIKVCQMFLVLLLFWSRSTTQQATAGLTAPEQQLPTAAGAVVEVAASATTASMTPRQSQSGGNRRARRRASERAAQQATRASERATESTEQMRTLAAARTYVRSLWLLIAIQLWPLVLASYFLLVREPLPTEGMLPPQRCLVRASIQMLSVRYVFMVCLLLRHILLARRRRVSDATAIRFHSSSRVVWLVALLGFMPTSPLVHVAWDWLGAQPACAAGLPLAMVVHDAPSTIWLVSGGLHAIYCGVPKRRTWLFDLIAVFSLVPTSIGALLTISLVRRIGITFTAGYILAHIWIERGTASPPPLTPAAGTAESEPSPPAPEPASDPKNVRMIQECAVCLDAPRTHVFLPCMHMCVCQQCAESMMASTTGKDCPLCREPVQDTRQIYY